MATKNTTTPETTETTEVATTTEHPLLQRRARQVKGWTEANAELRKAQVAEQSAPKPSAARAIAKKARLSWGAKKANRRSEISQTELDLRLAGVTGWSAWEEPEQEPIDTANSHRLPRSKAQLQASLDAVKALRATLREGSDDAVIHSAEVRVAALHRAAEARGYSLS